MNATQITYLFVIVVLTNSIIEFWLDFKNRKNIITNKNQVPEKFQDKITLEEHQKAADYTVAKINTSLIFKLVSLMIFFFWTLGGGLNIIDNFVRSFALSDLSTGLLFFAVFGVISLLLNLPQSLYSTFVIEERFGFNKMTPALFIKDMLKGLLLGIIIGAPLLAGLLWIMNALGTYWWIYAWLLLTGFQLTMLWVYPTVIAPLFNKFSPMEEGEVKEKVLALLDRTGFSSNGLFVMNASIRSSHGNAYFTGFGKNKRIVFFDTLIKTLEADEVEAVLAHELGHYKKKHVFKMIIKSFIFSFIGLGILGFLYKFQPFYNGHGVENISTYMALILFSMVSGQYTFLMTPISSYLSRKHEFEADEFAAKYAKASKLISALVKLYKDNANTLTPDETYSAFYHSHPPALTRVSFLEKFES